MAWSASAHYPTSEWTGGFGGGSGGGDGGGCDDTDAAMTLPSTLCNIPKLEGQGEDSSAKRFYTLWIPRTVTRFRLLRGCISSCWLHET